MKEVHQNAAGICVRNSLESLFQERGNWGSRVRGCTLSYPLPSRERRLLSRGVQRGGAPLRYLPSPKIGGPRGLIIRRSTGQVSDLTPTSRTLRLSPSPSSSPIEGEETGSGVPWAHRNAPLQRFAVTVQRYAAGACRGAEPLCVTYLPPRLGARGLKP